MSTCSPRLFVGVFALLLFTTGCEQVSAKWFPQMKNQPAVQAFESTVLTPLQGNATPRAQYSGFMPPDGAVAIDAEPIRTRLEGETLLNPLSEFEKAAHFANGKLMYETYCAVCHGVKGDGNGPVAPVFAVGGKGVFGRWFRSSERFLTAISIPRSGLAGLPRCHPTTAFRVRIAGTS